MKPSRSSSLETPQVYRKRGSVANGDRYGSSPQSDNTKTSSLETTDIESMNKFMKDIRDIVTTRMQREEQQLNDIEMEESIKMEWMLAASVFNRICAIGFGIVFVVGTLTFILFIVTHHRTVL